MKSSPFKFVKFALYSCSIAIGICLLVINIYGLTQPLRKPGLGVDDHSQLRFIPKENWSYEKTIEEINWLSREKNVINFLNDANRIVNNSLVHVDWFRVDPEVYRQLVPIWENYFLYAIGKYSGLPQFERYHYANYERNIKRGIGMCGDSATVLSSVLDKYQYSNRIISFDGHVIVEYLDSSGRSELYDPDFGVSLGIGLNELTSKLDDVSSAYMRSGYSVKEVDKLIKIYQTKYVIFENTYHFMTKRYIFEEVSYVAKWGLPVFLVLLPLIFLKKKSKTSNF